MKTNPTAKTIGFVAAAMILIAFVGVALLSRKGPDSTQVFDPSEPEEDLSAVSDLPFETRPEGAVEGGVTVATEQADARALLEQVALSASRANPKPVVTQPVGVSLTKNEVLASVNGKPVTAEDLIGSLSRSENAEVTISAEQFEFLLNRAIERELVFQAAQEAKIGLLEEDVTQLAQLREARTHDASVIDPIGDQDAILDADQVQAEAQLLEKRLLQKQGVPLPYVSDEDVLAHYETNIGKYGRLPDDPVQRDEAWKQIDLMIRRDLTHTARTEYQAKRDQYLLQLRANGQVEILASM